MPEPHGAHTSDLAPATLAAIRELLSVSFDDLTDEDWEHALGGMHALLWHDGALIGHGAVVQRRMLRGGRTARVGYIECVAVRPSHQRRGHGGTVMAELERIIHDAYDLGVLSATEDGGPFYAARGWQLWTGPTSALTPGGIVRTPEDDGAVYVLPGRSPVDVAGELTCDWREGDLW